MRRGSRCYAIVLVAVILSCLVTYAEQKCKRIDVVTETYLNEFCEP